MKSVILSAAFLVLFVFCGGELTAQITTGSRSLLFSSRLSGGQFTIRPFDELSLRVLGDERFSAEMQVDENGMLKVPFLQNDIRAAGLTIRELRREIELRLQSHMKSPRASVRFVQSPFKPVMVYARHDERGREIRVFTSPLYFESFKAWQLNLEVSYAEGEDDEIEFAFWTDYRNGAEEFQLTVLLDDAETMNLGRAIRPAVTVGGARGVPNKIKISLEILERIVKAEKVRMKLGHHQFELKDDDLKALRFMTDRLSQNKKAVRDKQK
jgi:hypothetical protein